MASSTVNTDVIQKIRKLIDFFEPFRQCDEETKTLLAQKGAYFDMYQFQLEQDKEAQTKKEA